MHDDFLSLELVTGQFAAVGNQTVLPWSRGALLLPWSKVLGLIHTDWVLDPQNYLGHCNKVNLLVVLQGFIHPVKESVQELWVVLEP